ncbi:MAG: MAPEG family protein [Caulobacter sp.]|nr:MAPEG family protein [Caulobacter sp.]
MLQSLLAPALALVIWSLIIWIWMYALRIPAMSKAKLDPQDARFPGSLNMLPDSARQVADNYNHLMEQPTIFYALVMVSYLSGQETSFTAGLAWAYVGLRVVHSLIQNTINRVPLRFLTFALSTIVLMVWAVCVALGAMG